MNVTVADSFYKATVPHFTKAVSTYVVPNTPAVTTNFVLQGNDGSGWTDLDYGEEYEVAEFDGEIIQRAKRQDDGSTVDWSAYETDNGGLGYRIHAYTISVSGTRTTYADETVTFAEDLGLSPVGPEGQVNLRFAKDMFARYLYAAGGNVVIDDDGIKIADATGATRIALGAIPPTSPSQGTGVYLDATGFFGLNNNTVMASISAVDGRLTAIAGNLVVDDVGMQFGLGVQGKKLPGTAANDTSAGTFPWTNPNNAKAEDGVFATTLLTGGGGGDTNYLFLTNLGFALPSSATVKGVVVEVKGKGTAGVSPFRARLLKGGALTGSNKSSSFSTTNAFTPTMGSTNDLWGATLAYGDINASNFGVALWLVESDVIVPSDISVDVVRVTVYYSTLTGADVIFMNGNFIVGLTSLTLGGEIALLDGMTAPGTKSGYASIYVDSADGDLKVKFGDGTVKTIVPD